MLLILIHSLILYSGLTSLGPQMHEFHLSKCDINYSPQESSLQISLNLFIDDLELALAQDGHDSLAICTTKESYQAESIMYDFIQKHLRIIVDDQALEMIWIGKEISEDLAAVWSYLEIPNINPLRSIVIENDILMSSFEDQHNVVKLVMDKKRKSFFLFNNKDFKGRMDL